MADALARAGRRTNGTFVVAASLTVAVGIVYPRSPPTGLAIAALPLALLVISRPLGRVSLLILGFLFVFQSSESITPQKIAVFVLYAALYLLSNYRERHSVADRRILRIATRFAILLIATSLGVSLLNRTAPIDWLRDSVPYFMVAMAPTVGVEIGRTVSFKILDAVFAGTTLLSALFTFLYWAEIRDIVNLGFGKLGMSSYVLPFTGILWGVARQRLLKPSLLWTFTISASLLGLLLTGTRTTVLAIPALAYVAWAKRTTLHTSNWLQRRRLTRAAMAACSILSIALIASPDWGQVSDRFSTVIRGSELSQDQSALARKRQTDAAFRFFERSYLFGVGPGKRIASYSGDSSAIKSYTVDSPAGVLADFGSGAFLLYAAIGIAMYAKCRSQSLAQVACKAFFLLIAASSFLISPLEDKGVSLGIALVVALSVAAEGAWQRETDQPQAGNDVLISAPWRIDKARPEYLSGRL